MKQTTIKLANQKIHIECIYPSTAGFLKDYVITDTETDMQVVISDSDIVYEREKSAAEDKAEGIPVREFPDEYLETLAVYRKIAEQMIERDTILFHGSCIAVDGEGYLFTAKSGTGKSTHTKLWRELFGERALMVNDDKPLIRISEDGVTVYGTPWDGKHHLSRNCAVPLKAICVLERGEENHIEKVTKAQVYPMLLQQMYRSVNPLKLSKSLQILDRLAEHVSFYRLSCNVEREAAETSFKGMK